MNPWLVGVVLDATGALITCAWVAYATKRNPAIRRRLENVADLVGWPVVVCAMVIWWPLVVWMVTVNGEPDDNQT
jgi:hypothetical protein